MPQMMPLNWISLFLFMILMFYMFNIMNFFLFFSSGNTKILLSSKKKINWSW